MDTWFDNVHLGIRIARRKLRTSLFGHPSQRRINEYQSEINSHFNDLERRIFLNEMQGHEVVSIKGCVYGTKWSGLT